MVSEYDDWIHSRIENTCFWIANLSNGKQIYQDEDRYPEPSILRLKEYVESNRLSIEKMFIRFRSHWEEVYNGKGDGLFFRRSILGGLFSEKNTHSYIIGTVIDNKIHCKKWLIPEIISTEEEIRDLDTDEGIIWNTKTE